MPATLTEIRARPLRSFGLNRHSLSKIFHLIGLNRRLTLSSPRNMKSGDITVGEAMEFIERRGEIFKSAAGRNFVKKMIDHGFTHLDWSLLPIESITPRLSGLKKEDILKLDIRALGTISGKALKNLTFQVSKDCQSRVGNNPPVTVHALITYSTVYNFECGAHWNYRRSFDATMEKLMSLGFGYEDGIFFQEGTRRKAIADLMTRHKVTKTFAEKFVDIAHKEGLIKLPLEK